MRKSRVIQLAAAGLVATSIFALGLVSARQTPQASQQTKQAKSAAAPASPEKLAAGRELFEGICASCHGLDGKGGERGPDIATRAEVTKLSDAETLKILREGVAGKGMPAFAAFGDEKLSAVLAYLRSLQGKGDAAAVPGNAHEGKKLFFGKAGCSECHMAEGVGGFLAPDLSKYAANRAAADIRGAIVSPDSRPGPRRGTAEITTKDGKSYSGVVRNEDNFSIQLQSTDGSFHLFSKSDLTSLKRSYTSPMPADYGTRLSPSEIDDLIAYLVHLAHGKRGEHDEEGEWLE